MKKFSFYKPTATGDAPALTIADIIPEGKDNAIKRTQLIKDAISYGLIDEDCCDKYRKLRQLLQRARLDYVILNNADGKGFYRPTLKDAQDLNRYIRQEESKAKSIFMDIKKAKALYEDFKYGRCEVKEG